MSRSIFLSHNSRDKPFVRKLAVDLRDAGVHVWLDEAEMKVGESLIEKISSGIANADYLAVVLSPRSVDAPWVQKELNVALSREIDGQKINVLPLVLEDCDRPVFLSDTFYADFSEPHFYEGSLDLLLRSIGARTGSNGRTEAELTLENLRSFLGEKYPNRNQSDWNDIAFLREQLRDIKITTVDGLEHLLQRSEPALRKQESGFFSVRLAATGAVRSSMWAADFRAANTCIGGRQIFKNYHDLVKSDDANEDTEANKRMESNG